MKYRSRKSPYCLHCFAPLSAADAARVLRCPSCNVLNLPSDRRVYWNRNPRLMARERGLKAVIVITLLLMEILILGVIPPEGNLIFWVASGPFAIGGLAWATASILTHRLDGFTPSIPWTIVFTWGAICCGTAVDELGPLGSRLGFLAFLLAAAASLLSRASFSRWKSTLLPGEAGAVVENQESSPPVAVPRGFPGGKSRRKRWLNSQLGRNLHRHNAGVRKR